MPLPNTEASPAIYPSPEHIYVTLETTIITNRLRLVLNEITVFTHELFRCNLGVNLKNHCSICHKLHYSYLGSTILNACIENEKCMKNGVGILTDQFLSNASYSVLGSGKKETVKDMRVTKDNLRNFSGTNLIDTIKDCIPVWLQ